MARVREYERVLGSGIARRDFLKLGGAGLAGATMLGVTGCGSVFGGGGDNGGGSNGGGGGGGAKTLNRNIATEIPDLNTATTTDAVSNEILLATNEGLYRLDENYEPQPAQAESVEVSDDKLTYTFKLRDGIQWSNGDPVTSQDFKYAWLKVLDPKTASQYAYIIGQFIEGGTEYNTEKGSADDVAIETPDDKTLRVKLTAPAPFWLGLTGLWTYLPQKQSFVEEQGDDYAQGAETLLYNGPYIMTKGAVGAGGDTQFKKNPDYWDADNVDIENITMPVVKDENTALNLYDTGQLDITGITGENVKRNEDNPEKISVIEYTVFYGQMNQQVEELKNVNIRKGLMSGFDRKTLANQILANGSLPAYAYVPPKMPGPDGDTFREANGDLIDPDPKAAKKFWDQGVEELGGAPDLTVLVGDTSTDRDIATFLQNQYKKNLDYEIKLEVVNFEAGLDRVDNKDYQISFVSGWGADYNDAMTFLDLWTTDSTFNRAAWSNKKFDQLISDAKKEPDQAKRMQMMLQAEKILLDEAVIVPEYFRTRVYLKKPYLKDFTFAPYGSGPDWKYSSLEDKGE